MNLFKLNPNYFEFSRIEKYPVKYRITICTYTFTNLEHYKQVLKILQQGGKFLITAGNDSWQSKNIQIKNFNILENVDKINSLNQIVALTIAHPAVGSIQNNNNHYLVY